MLVTYLKAKIHRLKVTDANLEYRGSITLGAELLDAARLSPFEKVDVYNITNGERFHTYVISGERGTVCLNGAAAWKVKPGDKIIVASYALLNEEEARTHKPRLVYVGEEGNSIERVTDSLDFL